MDELAPGHGLRFVGPALIAGDLFDLGEYPGMRHGEGRIVAELYALLEPGLLARLDDFEGVRPDRPRESLFAREVIALLEPAGESAWVYVYNRDPAPRERIASGDWRAYRHPRGAVFLSVLVQSGRERRRSPIRDSSGMEG